MNPDNADFITKVANGVRTIKFNLPKKKNAFTPYIYENVANILNADSNDDKIVVTIFTGIGEYYSSGTALDTIEQNYEEAVEKQSKRVERFVVALINYPKLLIAIVNGPVVGIAFTTLALCDVVYASDRATFHAPFTSLGFCPEGCSSYLFPRILGKSKAMEVLILGHKMTAQEAFQFNFISEVFEHCKLDEVIAKVERFGTLPINVVKRSKRLIKACLQDNLNAINKREMQAVKECMFTPEFFEAMVNFMSRKKSKL